MKPARGFNEPIELTPRSGVQIEFTAVIARRFGAVHSELGALAAASAAQVPRLRAASAGETYASLPETACVGWAGSMPRLANSSNRRDFAERARQPVRRRAQLSLNETRRAPRALFLRKSSSNSNLDFVFARGTVPAG
jgi:hypothetical protein